MPRPGKTNSRLAGKVAIITGAGSLEGGIGRSVALLLANEGANVTLIDQSEDRVEEVARLVRDEGGNALALTGDVSDPERCAQLVRESAAAFGQVDILVNNVGISGSDTSLSDPDYAAWSRMFDINLRSTVAMSAAAIARMKEKGGGSIVNIASVAGMQAFGNIGYGPSKAAMIAFTRETAVMHGRDGIRANVVAPGHIFTPHIGGILTPKARFERQHVAPLGIEGDAWDVAEAVLFLASDAARFITGLLMPVDGGVTAVAPLAARELVDSADPEQV